MALHPLRNALDRPVSLGSIRPGEPAVAPDPDPAKLTVTVITVTTITHLLG
jgi:hypothetical protein